jgi:hypothetical protein
MALPMQVQRDLVELEAYDKALAAEQLGDATLTEQTETTTEIVADPAEPSAAPEPIVEAESNVTPLRPEADAKEELTWQQRYRTLDGMIEAANRRNSVLEGQLAQVEQELVQLRSARTQHQQETNLVTDEEVEAFGADVIDVQRRVARAAIAPFQEQLEVLRQENRTLQERIGQTGSRVETMSFEQKLNMAIPDFEKLNADPKWAAWLDEVDPLLRAPRRIVAQAAYERGDIVATAAYVDLFRGSSKPVSSNVSEASAELRNQVAPSRSVSNASAPVNNQERMYTEAEAGALFDRVGLLYRQGKNEEASKLDAEVTAAYNAGRVR